MHTVFKLNFLLVSILLLLVLNSCNLNHKNFTDFKEYAQWLNDKSNGLIKSKSIAGVDVTVKYMPAEYLAYLELQDEANLSAKAKDSILSSYKGRLTFLLTLAPSKDEKTDIMQSGVQSYDEYASRVSEMNFDMDKNIVLKVGDQKYKQVLYNLENTYGLTSHRNIYLVFAPEDSGKLSPGKNELDFIFNDEIFDTGINHFTFNKTDIDNIPHFIFFNTQG